LFSGDENTKRASQFRGFYPFLGLGGEVPVGLVYYFFVIKALAVLVATRGLDLIAQNDGVALQKTTLGRGFPQCDPQDLPLPQPFLSTAFPKHRIRKLPPHVGNLSISLIV
jgi:hypothetical protein